MNMNTSIPLICRFSLMLAAPALLTQCAYDPVTRANASQASASEISRDARAALDDLYAKEPAGSPARPPASWCSRTSPRAD